MDSDDEELASPITGYPHAIFGGITELHRNDLRDLMLAVGKECWICLQCHYVACTKYELLTTHLMSHMNEFNHPIAASMSSLSVFCYECEDTVLASEMIAVSIKRRSLSSRSLFRGFAFDLIGREKVLASPTIEAFAEYIKVNNCKNIVVMTGAGLSTSAGIPDFRTPGTGLYYNLQKFNLPTPESVFEMDYFIRNPKPFFLLAKELYPGNFKPTVGHYFIKVLSEKKMLVRNFTQNIDTLERVAGIDESLLVEAHGSFATASCIGHFNASPLAPSDESFSFSPTFSFTPPYWVKKKVFEDEIPRCLDCGGLVKPDITFFGESLPTRLDDCLSDLDDADAIIVMGSSLQVFPFALLPSLVRNTVPRLLINRELAGDFDEDGGFSGADATYLGTCDDGCLWRN
ncbi:SIR2-domain-containing protein, partial [Rhizoclosmatium globosum]